MNCMNYNQNQHFGLFKFLWGYITFYLNSPKCYSRKIINTQTAYITGCLAVVQNTLLKQKVSLKQTHEIKFLSLNNSVTKTLENTFI